MDAEIDYENLEDEELVRRLEDASLMSRFESSDDWQIVREACRRAAERAKNDLIKVNPDQKTTVIELQKIAQIYGSFIPNLVKSFRKDGEMAFEEAENRGILGRLRAAMKRAVA